MNNKKLLIVFLSLLGVYFLSQYGFKKQTRSFKTELIQVDTAKVTAIMIYPKSDNQEELTLNRNGEGWTVSKGNLTTAANEGAVKSLLNNLALIKTKRVAAKSPEKWKDYEVEETTGSRIKAYAGDDLVADFIVGRFNYNQQTRQGLSYLRLTKGEETYAVDGFLSMTMGQGFDAYRNKQLIKVDQNQLTQIALNTLGLTEIYQKNGSQWLKDGTAIDSTKMANYLNGIQTISGSTFVNDFNETATTAALYQTLSLEGNNITTPIIIKAFRDTTNTPSYILHSSLNPDGYFSSEESGIYKRIFGDLN